MRVYIPGMGIVHEKANFHCIESDFLRRKTTVRVEKKSAVQKGSTRSHAAIARLGHVIVNTVTRCYSRGLATGLNTVILTCFCAMFRLRKSECYESFESESSGGRGGGARFQSSSFESMCVCASK